MLRFLRLLLILACCSSTALPAQTTDTLISLEDSALEFENATTVTAAMGEARRAALSDRQPAVPEPVLSPQNLDLLANPRIPRYEFSPPLSISDAIYLIRCALFILDESNRDYVPVDAEKLDLLLGAILNYARLLDNRYSTLRHYSWTALSKTRVARDAAEAVTIDLNPPINSVSAIAVRVTGADAEILELRVRDDRRQEFGLAPYRTVILRDRPAREVIFFNRQVRIAQIVTRARTLNPEQSAELCFEAGIASVPEHVKYAIREMKQARELVKAGDYPGAGNSLRDAWRNLLYFRAQQNI